jgi:hypothetical protein
MFCISINALVPRHMDPYMIETCTCTCAESSHLALDLDAARCVKVGADAHPQQVVRDLADLWRFRRGLDLCGAQDRRFQVLLRFRFLASLAGPNLPPSWWGGGGARCRRAGGSSFPCPMHPVRCRGLDQYIHPSPEQSPSPSRSCVASLIGGGVRVSGLRDVQAHKQPR